MANQFVGFVFGANLRERQVVLLLELVTQFVDLSALRLRFLLQQFVFEFDVLALYLAKQFDDVVVLLLLVVDVLLQRADLLTIFVDALLFPTVIVFRHAEELQVKRFLVDALDHRHAEQLVEHQVALRQFPEELVQVIDLSDGTVAPFAQLGDIGINLGIFFDGGDVVEFFDGI